MSIICSNCGHDNQSDAQYCDECGVVLPAATSVEEEYIPAIHNEEEIAPQPVAELNSHEFDSDVDSNLNSDIDSVAESNGFVDESEPKQISEYVPATDSIDEPENTVAEAQDRYMEQEPSVVSVDESPVLPEPETEAVESPPSMPIATPTRLEFDEPEIDNTPLKSSATTLELPQAVLIDSETGDRFELPTAEKAIHIGRLNDEFPIHVDLSNITHADLISRIHASIHLENDLYYLEDAGSANGTWLNGEAIKPGTRFRQQLHHGDTIAFGRNQTVKLTLELD